MVANLTGRSISACVFASPFARSSRPALQFSSKISSSRTFAGTCQWCQSRPSSSSLRDKSSLGTAQGTKIRQAQSILETTTTVSNDGDILQAWDLYQGLEAKGLLHAVGAVGLIKMENLIEKELLNVDSKLSSQNLESLAIMCAANGRTGALRHIMYNYLKDGKADHTVIVYEKLRAASKGGGQREEGSSGPSQLAEEGADEIDLLAPVVIAHAFRNSFEDALEVVLRHSLARFPASRVSKVAEDLQVAHDVRERVLKYTSAIEVAALISRPDKFRGAVQRLADSRSNKHLEHICLQLASGFEGDLAWATTDKMNLSRSRPVIVEDTIWAALIRSLTSCRNDDYASRIWAKMTALGVVPSADIWHGLLEGYRATGRYDQLLSAWDSMVQAGVKPNAATYCSRILALFDGRKKRQAMISFGAFRKEMQREAPAEALVVYNAVIRSLLKVNELEDARTILQQMSADGLQPDIVSYNTIIHYFSKKGDMESVLSMVNEVSKIGLSPDVVTFTTVYVGLLKAGHEEATEKLLKVMKHIGIEPNVATYSAMIDQIVRRGTSEGIRSGRELLDKMEKTTNARPNEITYTSFLMGIHRCNELTEAEVADATEEILQRMDRRGVRVKLGTYHTLLKSALARESATDRLSAFHNYYRAMVKKKIRFAHDTWYIIISGLIRRNEWDLAKVMVEDMQKSGFQPMWGLQEMVRSVMKRPSHISPSMLRFSLSNEQTRIW